VVDLLRFRCRVFSLVFFCCLIGDKSTIDIRAIASKTTIITKFEVEKFDGKSNFLLWKMLVTSLLMKEGTHKALFGIEKKPSKMEDKSRTTLTSAKGNDHTMPIR